jgi:hypothetical protein
VRHPKEGNGPTTSAELLYSNVNHQNDSNRTEKGATQVLMLLGEKQEGTIKGRMVYNGSQQENGYQ